MTYTKESFIKRLEEAYPWQIWVAKFLEMNGIKVEVPPLTTDKPIDWYTKNDTDIILPSGDILEIKTRNLRWSNHLDYPYKTMWVDTVDGYDKKEKRPIAYVFVSKKTGSIIWVPSDPSLWFVVDVTDKERKITYKAYAVSSEYLLPADLLIYEANKLIVK